MKLSTGINWDETLLNEISTINCVSEVYASMDSNPVGSGRPAIVLPKVTQEFVESYIKQVHNHNIQFCYLLNGSCLGNLEFEKNTNSKIIEYIEWLNSIGVDSIKVTIPYLLELIKKHFPKLKVVVSTISGVNSINSAKLWESMGADKITLDFMINRNFDLIKVIRRAVKCEIELLLNDVCLYNCPYRNYHYNLNAHASQLDYRPYSTYCLLHCTLDRLENHAQILMSPWIRPEDIEKYEKLGVNNFKISGRRNSSKWLLRTINAYARRKYPGNLMDLLVSVVFGSNTDINSFNNRDIESPEFKKYITNIDKIPPDRKMWNELPPFKGYIDNSLLSGFIEYFENGCCDSECDKCTYCLDWANKVVNFDPHSVYIYKKMCKKFLHV